MPGEDVVVGPPRGVEGVERGKILQLTNEEGFFHATVRMVAYKVETTPQLESAVSRATSPSAAVRSEASRAYSSGVISAPRMRARYTA